MPDKIFIWKIKDQVSRCFYSDEYKAFKGGIKYIYNYGKKDVSQNDIQIIEYKGIKK